MVTDPNWIISHDLMKYDYAAYKSSWEDTCSKAIKMWGVSSSDLRQNKNDTATEYLSLPLLGGFLVLVELKKERKMCIMYTIFFIL